MRIEYHPAIEFELQRIVEYYNDRSPGLGTDFLEEFEQSILKIASMPTRWIIVEDDVRRSLMKRFPYVVYFRVLDEDVLRVTAVRHQRRHPRYGKDRR